MALKTAFEIARDWYDADSIHRSINRTGLPGAFGAVEPIPRDVQSKEFAEWLTRQYRLAMVKGIQLGREREDLKAEIERLNDALGYADERERTLLDSIDRIRELHAEEGAKWESRINELQAIVDTLTAGAEWCGLVVEPAIGVNVCLWTLPNCDGREGRTLLEAAEAARKEQA